MKRDGRDGPAPTAADPDDDEMDPLTYRILAGFDRPPQPPAPTPERRSSSDGGRFVAYSATVQPARSRRTQASHEEALVELSHLIEQPDPTHAPPPLDDVPTVVSTWPGARSRAQVLVAVSVTVTAALLIALGALVAWRSSSRSPAADPLLRATPASAPRD
jgi:hypothetical protein